MSRIHTWQFWPSNCYPDHYWVATSNTSLNQKRVCRICGMPNWIDFLPTGVIYHERRTTPK